MAEHPPPIPLLVVPGWLNSGPEHWQSHWQRRRPEMARVDFGEWHHPQPGAWTAALHQAVLASPRPPLLIAHSLGCLAAANLMALSAPPPIAGALLVAPPDPGQAHTPAELAVFAPPARSCFHVPGLVVVSSTDIYAKESYGVAMAQAWGLEVVCLGACGHINDESGHGPWPEGLALLDGLLGRIARAGSCRQPWLSSGAPACGEGPLRGAVFPSLKQGKMARNDLS